MESMIAGLSSAQASRGPRVRVVTLDEASGIRLPEGMHRGVPYQRLPRWGPRQYPSARGLLEAVADADIVHVHSLDGLADQLAARREQFPGRLGISTHGGFFHTDRHRWLKSLWLRTVTRRTLSRADAVWFTSEADAVALAAAGVEGTVIPDGVDVARFRRIARAPEPGRWLVLGRIDVHKGLTNLLRVLVALARVDPRAFDVRVVGPDRIPGLRASLQAQATQSGLTERVRFLGPVTPEAVDDELARCELALFPSQYEGFGISVVEAMAAGVPVVVNAIPAFDRLVTPGRDGWRFDTRKPDEAAALLAGLRERDHSAIGEAARVTADRYSWEQQVFTWEAAYSRILASS
jgi:alpha-1,3-mannosyltransferase